MSANKLQQHKPTRESLLQELEALKQSLSTDNIDTMPIKEEPTEIPTLTDLNEDEAHAAPDPLQAAEETLKEEALEEIELIEEDATSEIDTQPATSAHGQQQLFEDHAAITGKHTVTAKGENPFLPQHIRERLSQNKNTILEELAHVGESLARTDNRATQDKNNPPEDALIDELVGKYLPRIEQELRARLKEQLKK